ncbi:hypothetical protein [Streptomyces sp. NPDC006645]|uniref:hypothetical protein n=1 Tax=unclassified Streptomyces TaxID=2593676 RepID=UPI0033BB4DDA
MLAWLVGRFVVSNLSIGLDQAATPVIVVQQLGHSTGSVGLIWCVAVAVARRRSTSMPTPCVSASRTRIPVRPTTV